MMAVPDLPRWSDVAWRGRTYEHARESRNESVPFSTVTEHLLYLDPVADIPLDIKMNTMSCAPWSPYGRADCAML